MKRRTAKAAERAAKKYERWKAANLHQIGRRHPVTGTDFKTGDEWDTSDGFRVRVVDAHPNRVDPKETDGVVEVIGFAEGKK